MSENEHGSATTGDDAELAAMPKADLHVHLVGSAAVNTVAELAARHPAAGVPPDPSFLQSFFAFRDFPHFLDVYSAVSRLIRTPDDVVNLVLGLARDLRREGTAYAEVTVTPLTHVRMGIPSGELAQALDTGAVAARENGVDLAWIYDVCAGEGQEGAQLTLDFALGHPPAALVGFGLGGTESGVQRARFSHVFSAARAAGLHSVPHAGESTGPREIWAAVDDLGAERVGHGISAVEDPSLGQYLAEKKITLEVCPSSNVATGVVRSIAEHPLPRLLAAGIPVVLGSDDPPMFGTTLLGEYRLVRDQLGLTGSELRALARNSIEMSFASPQLKVQLLNTRRDFRPRL